MHGYIRDLKKSDLDEDSHERNSQYCWCNPSINFLVPEPGDLFLKVSHGGRGVSTAIDRPVWPLNQFNNVDVWGI